MFGEKFTPEAYDAVKFTFEVSTSNAGISDDPDNAVADLLEEVARSIRSGIGSAETLLRDYNGQVVGKATYTVEENESDGDDFDEE